MLFKLAGLNMEEALSMGSLHCHSLSDSDKINENDPICGVPVVRCVYMLYI